MTIELGDISDYQNKRNILIDSTNNYFWYYNYYRPQYRINIIKEQIILNLPQVISNPNDLHIFIRSGDVFSQNPILLDNYLQPPLCFYTNIINNFKCENIHIVSENKNNPVIDELLIK